MFARFYCNVTKLSADIPSQLAPRDNKVHCVLKKKELEQLYQLPRTSLRKRYDFLAFVKRWS